MYWTQTTSTLSTNRKRDPLDALPVPDGCIRPSGALQGDFSHPLDQTVQFIAISLGMALEAVDALADEGVVAGGQAVDIVIETSAFHQQLGLWRAVTAPASCPTTVKDSPRHIVAFSDQQESVERPPQ